MSDPGAIIHWPFGPADKQAQKPYAAVIAATVVNNKTIIPIAQMTGNATLNLTLSDRLTVGADLTVNVSADPTNRTLTHGTGLVGVSEVLTASKSYVIKYQYNGTAFAITSVKQQD